ncbi:hypothetical protein [Mesorhizobium sp. M0140]|uniref:hypothetical protein n=1 Tax=Mesorhizobium sp. M0140 TaxID=2956893 RepID=UPI00333A514F
MRVALYEAANVMLTRLVNGSALKSWALAVANRAGMRNAKVALARKLAVVLHRMMRSGEQFLRASRTALSHAEEFDERISRRRNTAGHGTSPAGAKSLPGRWIPLGR